MASFCVQCGAPLTGAFCVKCGADAGAATNSAQGQTSAHSAEQIRAVLEPPTIAKKGLSPVAKLGIAALAIIFVGVAAAVGVYYVAHRVSQKFHQVSDGVLASNSDSGSSSEASSSSSSDNSLGDVCRFLSKEDVTKAIGVQIVRTQSEDNGCSYIARGTQTDMLAKHAAAMSGDMGADKKTQQVVQAFAGGMGKMFQSEEPVPEPDAAGEGPVFTVSLDQNGAEEQMRLNAAVLGNLGPQQRVPAIGDQAFVTADGMMMVRKGKTLARIMYMTCPCGTKQVIPLAKKLAGSL